MELLAILAILAFLGALAVSFGADSRPLNDGGGWSSHI